MKSTRAFRTCALNVLIFFSACSGGSNEASQSSGPDRGDAGESMGKAPWLDGGESMGESPWLEAGLPADLAPFDPELEMAACNEQLTAAECLFAAIDRYDYATECGSSPFPGEPERRMCLELAYAKTDAKYRSCMEASQWKLAACAVVAACDFEEIILCRDQHLERTKKCPSAPPALLDAIDVCTKPSSLP